MSRATISSARRLSVAATTPHTARTSSITLCRSSTGTQAQVSPPFSSHHPPQASAHPNTSSCTQQPHAPTTPRRLPPHPRAHRAFHSTPRRAAKGDESTIDYFRLPALSVSHPLSAAPGTNHSASYLTSWYPAPYVFSGSAPSTGETDPYNSLAYLSDLSRYPLLPDSFNISHAEAIQEQEVEAVERPKINVIAASPDVVSAGAPLAEIEGVGDAGERVELGFVRDLHGEPKGGEEGGLVSDLWKGFLDDVFGPKKEGGGKA